MYGSWRWVCTVFDPAPTPSALHPLFTISPRQLPENRKWGRMDGGRECYNQRMDADLDMKFYRERWKVVEEIERQELRTMSIEKHWKQINNLVRFAIENGLTRGDDDSEMAIFLRWAKMKATV